MEAANYRVPPTSLYGDGEELLGKWFKRTGKRNDIFLATKFGFVKGSKTYEVDSTGAYCKKACDASLRALGVDTIDLCMSLLLAVIHSPLIISHRLHASCQPEDAY